MFVIIKLWFQTKKDRKQLAHEKWILVMCMYGGFIAINYLDERKNDIETEKQRFEEISGFIIKCKHTKIAYKFIINSANKLNQIHVSIISLSNSSII